MSTLIDASRDPVYDRELASEMLQTEVFSAFYALREFRRNNVGLSNADIGRLCGWSRSQVSKLLSGPQNWTLETISQLAFGLSADFKFVLIDRTERSRNFNAGGLSIDFQSHRNFQQFDYNMISSINQNRVSENRNDIPNMSDKRQSGQMMLENYRNKFED